jgi:Skp family chaperone for outer membrane proteins
MKVINMEALTVAYIPYVEFMNKSEEDRTKLTNRVEEIRKEMQDIAKLGDSLILDETTKNNYVLKFQNLQREAHSLEEKFRTETLPDHQDLYEEVIRELGSHIEEYAQATDLDLVIPTSQTFFYKSELDITDEVLSFLESKNLRVKEEVGTSDVPA